MNKSTTYVLSLVLIFVSSILMADNGYKLWLRYDKISNSSQIEKYTKSISQVIVDGKSATLNLAKEELALGFEGMLGLEIPVTEKATKAGALILGTSAQSQIIKSLKLEKELEAVGEEGYLILSRKIGGKTSTVIAAKSDIGVYYGTFHFLRLLQTQQDISNLSVKSAPRIQHRILNHWDNLDRTVERGYAGFSLWDWHKLPDFIDQRYLDYARANASIGINGTVLTNVNANALVLTPEYLKKVTALADAFRPYGMKVYLTARFSAPIEIGGLKTADPTVQEVKDWWKKKADEIYASIPDFGGFLVKADSEGQPGPHSYKKTQAEGANTLADAVAPHGGIVMWRAFVYSNETPDDRAKQAYNEFKPLDGKFRKNVTVQVKNGAIDFQPREPFHPLFGAMPETSLTMEFQITQEYLGQGTHLAYLAPMYKEVLEADTHAKGEGSTVAKVIDGSLHNYELTAIAGVSNIGNDINWTSHHFGQANWYAFGRLAWNHQLSSEEIAEEWIKMTFTNQREVLEPVKNMMLNSHEAVVNYMTPLGLHHIMGWSHHYGPGPWIKDKHRADWTSVYYHQADSLGIGFDRTETGSNAIEQYFPPVAQKYGSLEECPEKYLLWFHHVNWNHTMDSGRTLWDELCYKYSSGVDTVRQMQKTWEGLARFVDKERFEHVQTFLSIQEKDARMWRDACLLYFQTFSKQSIPEELEKPEKTLEEYINFDPKFVPGI